VGEDAGFNRPPSASLTLAAIDMTTKKKRKIVDKSTSKFWKWSTGQTLGYGFILSFVVIFLWVSTRRTIENFQLAKYGLLTKAVVLDKKRIGGKGTIDFKITYTVSGQQYEGSLTNEPWEIGDSVDILYLTTDPTIIRSYRFISENYSTDIKK
jgi:hypothetical protein